MKHTFKIIKIYLKNFIGIKTGLKLTEFELDLKPYKNKDIFLLVGPNGYGKTTLSSVMHALPGTTDKREIFIIEGEEGVKKVTYERSDGTIYECKIVYTPTKTGHSSKGFISKTIGDDIIELNSNGNITSYKDILIEELGLTTAILKLASQNDITKGYVDMTSTERKVNMASFLPNDIYSNKFAIADKMYKTLRTKINILVDDIGRMHDDQTIKTQLEIITNKINNLVEKRDKCIGKLKEYETRIKIIVNEDDAERKEKQLSKSIKNNQDEMCSIQNKITNAYNNKISNISSMYPDAINSDSTADKISEIANNLKNDAQAAEIELSILSNNLYELKNRRNDIIDLIFQKENLLKDIIEDCSLNDLNELLRCKQNRKDDLEIQLIKLNTSLTKEDLITGSNVVIGIQNAISAIYDHNKDGIDEAINSNETAIKDMVVDINNQINELKLTKGTLLSKITDLSNTKTEGELKERPSNCKIDNCPYLEDARRLKYIEAEISKHMRAIDIAENKLNELDKKLELYSEVFDVFSRIQDLYKFVDANISLVSKLPGHDKIDNHNALNEAIIKGGRNLIGLENYDKFICILDDKEELQELKYKIIPNIENNIKIIESQGKFIDSTKTEVYNLKCSLSNINAAISDLTKRQSELETKRDVLKEFINSLGTFYDIRKNYDNIYSELSKDFKELQIIKDKLSILDEYRENYREKKAKLSDIEEELTPLTRDRERYKMEQLKLADNKTELEAVKIDAMTCGIIRDALSIKDKGMPVSDLEMFMDDVRYNANSLLSNTFNGSLYLEEFEITEKDFIMPYRKNGILGIDVSYASSSERSFISMSLTFAIIEEIVSGYGICIFDEIDRGFDDTNKLIFMKMFKDQMDRAGLTQSFIVTHNHAYYEGYDVAYVIFSPQGVRLTNKLSYDEKILINESQERSEK